MQKISVNSLVGTLYIGLVTIYLYFQYFSLISSIGNVNVLFLAFSLLLFGAFVLLHLKRIRLYGEDFALMAYCLYVVLDGVFRTPHPSEAFEYWSILLAVFAFKVVLQQKERLIEQYITALRVCSLLATGAIVLQFVLPGAVSAVQQACFTSGGYQEAVRVINLGYCTGITPFAASAVWFCAIMSAIAFAGLLCRKGAAWKHLFLCAWSLLAMFLTQKRAVLLAALITAYAFYFLFTRNRGTRMIRIAGITVVLLLAVLVAYQTLPQMQYMIDKTFFSDRALSGREALWSDMRPLFERNHVFGSGGGTCQYMFGYGGHNCYLQLLAEYGYVGLILFLLAFVAPFLSALYRTVVFLRTKRETKQAAWLLTALFLQAVFLIYCVSGNPLFDGIFIMTQMACMGISSHILQDIKLVRIKWG